jgi:hypothetical protein
MFGRMRALKMLTELLVRQMNNFMHFDSWYCGLSGPTRRTGLGAHNGASWAHPATVGGSASYKF